MNDVANTIALPERVTIEALRDVIAGTSTRGAGDIVLKFPDACFVETDAVALLTSWLLGQKNTGRGIVLEGKSDALGYLARMDFHKVLGLDVPEHTRLPEAGRFIPIKLVDDGDDVFAAVNSIADLVLQHFDAAPDFLPAFEWAVNEIIDNIFIHSQTKTPGIVCGQLFDKTGKLHIAICDQGIGIKKSLASSYPMGSDEAAIGKALERGITRDPEVGQGNGMAGALEILTKNQGDFKVWSGDATFDVKRGPKNAFRHGGVINGTGVSMAFNLERPVSLGDTWIGERGWSYINQEAERLSEQDIVIKDVCSHTASRPPATRLRRKVNALLPEMETPLTLDFKGVKTLSSSFLDELLGRLMNELGEAKFKESIAIKGLSDLHMNMANNVIGQRMQGGTANAWILFKNATRKPRHWPHLTYLELGSLGASGVRDGDWILICDESGSASYTGRIFRRRTGNKDVCFYFDKSYALDGTNSVIKAGLAEEVSNHLKRLKWDEFEQFVRRTCGKSIQDIDLVEDAAYVRELLQLAVIDDLLGPANGPDEEIVDMSVRDRYLVGKLAPRDSEEGGIEGGLEGAPEAEDEEEPDDLEIHTGRHDTGAEFEGSTGRVDAEADAADEIDAASNQSLIPSSLGFTFCVDGDVESVEVEAVWGQYVREYDHDHTKPIKKKIKDEHGNVIDVQTEEIKAKVWQRVPRGGTIKLDLKEGVIAHQAPDKEHPEVRIQGTVRSKNANGDRLVTLFLVNAQIEPDQNKDSAWVFQPEIFVRAVDGSNDKAIFRRRLSHTSKGDDSERDALEMIYRKQVEFAVGHGVAVHATTVENDPERGVGVRTVIIPQYEVPVTETPGLRAEDRPAMKEMIESGYLDMEVLATMERDDLVKALSLLSTDYGAWIAEQAARISSELPSHEDQARPALDRCKTIKERLDAGIAILANASDDRALAAFRFANRAMASQRIQSLYALARRRGEKVELADFQVRKNRSWRPFQLAFILLSLPSLADPSHKDRTEPLEAFADLLWFPTGGGKTEAYLGVAAFAMAIRRLQGNLGGYDGTRGLGVIMRYTLRLLTLQQFQRASTLICAMELLRQEAIANGDNSLGDAPFTIGLWVGNKVTPGSTSDSDRAIKNIRDEDKFDAGGTSPAQLTSCPWCGTEVSDKRDIEVDTVSKRTKIYCGDKLSRCEFSKGKSSKKTHPGLPVLVVDEEIYHRPPSMMIATVDKFALMAWRGETRTLFGRATTECPRHGLLWPGSDCTGTHNANRGQPPTKTKTIAPIRPPDLIIQDEFHLISGPLGTMVGLYETAIDELCGWDLDGRIVKPKIVASTATVRKAVEQVNNVFMRRVAVFPPHGLEITDNFFSVQRPIEQIPGRRYLGVCSPGSSRPAMLIRVYTAFLTASQSLFDRFGQVADPFLTAVGYFNSLRELGGMKRLAEDDVQTRSYRVGMSLVKRPGLAQRSVNNICELTSRVSSRDIPKYLDQLEVKFKAEFDPTEEKFVTKWVDGETRSIDVVLATNMLSVGVDVNRLGLMVVNGQPKGTAEYIQATSRVGRAFPGLVCTVLTWARPRDLSHYETFEHYHATFYKHVEAQSVTPFSPRAMDRGLTGAFLSVVRLENDDFNPNPGASALDDVNKDEIVNASKILVDRAWGISQESSIKGLASEELKERVDEWVSEATKGGRILAYEKKGKNKDTMVALLHKPGITAWDNFTVPMSMREVEPGVRLVMSNTRSSSPGPAWTPPPITDNDGSEDE